MNIRLLATFAVGAILAGAQPCATDPDCAGPDGGPDHVTFRCCGTHAQAENCPKPPMNDTGSATCTLPGATGVTTCRCAAMNCTMTTERQISTMKTQWLMIGDSISGGVHKPLQALAAARGIQLVRITGNGANVWWGQHCLDAMLGKDPKRWDIITYQFGLHDLALDNELVEPLGAYTEGLRGITARLAAVAKPGAKLSWVTTTPVPLGIDGYCNKTTGEGGCPPRRQADPPIYNAAAAGVIAAHNAVAAARSQPSVRTIDLYSVVTKRCGATYARCPANCTGENDCFQRPLNVHFFDVGWQTLAQAYMAAAD